ncbi:MAG TPA: adenylate/guanylate cyclase domain-containing protein [Gemmatimonadales bacterium]|jgi:class 3 adenylate cyclase
MANAAELRAEVIAILSSEWKRRKGATIPTTESVKLDNDGVELDATVLYADLVDSTDLVNGYKDWFAAEVYKSYLRLACRIIRDNGGDITSFDGDRVMAVYIGESKNSQAAKTALKLNWAVKNILNTEIQKRYTSTTYKVQHVVGIDTSKLFVARTGIRGTNDLVWVGRAANYAAKLCGLRDGSYASIITEDVYNRLEESAKNGGSPRQAMWQKATWQERAMTIYQSSWWWSIG